MEELLIEEEALFLNREMLTEVKNLIDDINDIKPPNHLKHSYIHNGVHTGLRRRHKTSGSSR